MTRFKVKSSNAASHAGKRQTCLTASNMLSFAVIAAAAMADAVGNDDVNGATDICWTFGGVTHYTYKWLELTVKQQRDDRNPKKWTKHH